MGGMDSFTLAHVVCELRGRLQHGTVQKVQPISPFQFILKLTQGQLVISADDSHPGMFYARRTRRKTIQWISPFLLLARKFLVGSCLVDLDQLAGDRVVRFRFAARDREPVQEVSLIAEMIDRRANLYLLDSDDRVIQRLTERTHERIPPGTPYVLPLQKSRLDPWTVTRGQFDLVLQAPSLREGLLHSIRGLGPVLADEVVWRARSGDAYSAYRALLQEHLTSPSPHIYSPTPLDEMQPGQVDWKRQLILSPIALQWPVEREGMVAQPFGSMLDGLERYEELVEAIRTFQSERSALITSLRRRRRKANRVLKSLEGELQKTTDPEKDRRFGELLLSNIGHAQRGDRGFLVIDHYSAARQQVEIPAEPYLTVQQAAEFYFNRYRKKKRTSEAIKRQVIAWEQEVSRLERRLEQIDKALTYGSIERLEEDFGNRSARSSARPEPQQIGERLPGMYQFGSSEQLVILVGRTAEANQRLTFRVARPHDIWLHAADYPGSHVILRLPKGSPVPHTSLVEAAQLAAFYSQARSSKKVVVHYTERKYVHKIPRAAAGLVRLAAFKSITVEPRREVKRIDVQE